MQPFDEIVIVFVDTPPGAVNVNGMVNGADRPSSQLDDDVAAGGDVVRLGVVGVTTLTGRSNSGTTSVEDGAAGVPSALNEGVLVVRAGIGDGGFGGHVGGFEGVESGRGTSS